MRLWKLLISILACRAKPRPVSWSEMWELWHLDTASSGTEQSHKQTVIIICIWWWRRQRSPPAPLLFSPHLLLSPHCSSQEWEEGRKDSVLGLVTTLPQWKFNPTVISRQLNSLVNAAREEDNANRPSVMEHSPNLLHYFSCSSYPNQNWFLVGRGAS